MGEKAATVMKAQTFPWCGVVVQMCKCTCVGEWLSLLKKKVFSIPWFGYYIKKIIPTSLPYISLAAPAATAAEKLDVKINCATITTPLLCQKQMY